MAKKHVSRNHNRKRAQNALEIAERELYAGMSSSDEDDRRNNPRLNGTIVNPQKRSRNDSDADGDDEDEDDFEDEEIDSDEAFGSDEDIDVLNSKFSQTIRDKQKRGEEIDEIDEEEGYTSIDEDDLMPLSAIWDVHEKQDKNVDHDDDNILDLNDNDVSSSEDDLSSSEEDESDDEEDEDPFDEVSDDEIELSTVSKKLAKDSDSKKSAFKKLDNAVVGEENEFALPSSTKTSSSKLNLADILSVVDDADAVGRASLIKQGENKAMAVPLPQRIQKRNERKAAYEISKDEVSKWQDTVQQNRRADHLNFATLNEPEPKIEASTFTPIEKPMTELEKKVSDVMKKSNLMEITKQESTFEEIATAKMTPEEMRKRTAELRLMRDLMFREERKAKRIKKIKSKTFRKIKKKELMRNQALVDEDEDEDDEESREARDIARAKERMTLKHKTSSKWAQDMIKHGMTKDKETRDEMEEMLRQGERLKAKVLGHESGDESDRDLSNLDSSDDENADENRAKVGKSGVLNMAFMKNAEARERERNKSDAEELRRIRESDGMEFFQGSTEDTKANITVNAGRRVYTPAVAQNSVEMEELDEEVQNERKIDEETTIEKRITKAHEKKAEKSKKSKTLVQKDEQEDTANPWLDGSDDEDYQGKRNGTIHVVDETSSKLSKSANKINKKQAKQESKKNSKKGKNEDFVLDLDSSNTLNIIDPYGGSDSEEFKQQDVIAEAFAGDDVVSKFEEEKKRVAIDEDDKEIDVTLPGWGDWAGEGSNPRKKRKFIKTVKGVVDKNKRKDKNLKNVIINEKVNKKNLKYQSSAVPFPYENREQYERSLRMPIGQEWTSSNTHSKAIKPRIITKPSAVIDPLKQPFK